MFYFYFSPWICIFIWSARSLFSFFSSFNSILQVICWIFKLRIKFYFKKSFFPLWLIFCKTFLCLFKNSPYNHFYIISSLQGSSFVYLGWFLFQVSEVLSVTFWPVCIGYWRRLRQWWTHRKWGWKGSLISQGAQLGSLLWPGGVEGPGRKGGSRGRRVCLYTRGWFTSFYSRIQHSIVKQLYSNVVV